MAITMEDGRALRIAVALTALRHKPHHQTYDSYVLDLRAKFPLPSAGVAESSRWRERALALERELQELQDKHRSESLELVTLRAKAKEAPPSPQPSTGKKKPKKKGPPPSVCVSGSTKIDSSSSKSLLDPNLRSTLPELFRSPSLLIPLEVLGLKSEQLPHQKRKQIDETYLLAIERALDAATELLVTQLPPQEQPPNAPSVIKALCRVVPYILLTVTPVVSGRSSRKSGTNPPKCSENTTNAVDRILGRLSTTILNPLVRSFAPLSDLQLSVLISPQKQAGNATHSPPRGRSEVVDIRYDVLGLFHKIIDTLREIGLADDGTLASNIQNLVHCLTLEAVRQLESLFQNESSQAENNLGETRQTSNQSGRLAKVARKDALWFLCNVLHLMLAASVSLSGCSADPGLEAGSLLEEAIYTALSALLRRMRSNPCHTIDIDATREDVEMSEEVSCVQHGVIDEVERGMILAVIEKAALRG